MSISLVPDKSFLPGRNDSCFCGSNQRFKNCCGLLAADRPPPHGLGIDEQFLSAEDCRELVALVDSHESQPFFVKDWRDPNKIFPDPDRKCNFALMGDSQSVLDALVYRAFGEVILPATGKSIEWYEEPQLLRYGTGGFYFYHADGWEKTVERNMWRKVLDRDISMLIYLRNDFEGGELQFKRFNYSLKPKAGMLVWFPSDMRYQHMAKPVTSGTRYAIVSWAAEKDVERVHEEPVGRSINWDSKEKN